MFQRLAGSLSFAHLAGLSRAKGKKADEEADKPACDDDDPDAAKASTTADDEDGKKGKKAKKAAGDEAEELNDDEEGDEDEEDKEDDEKDDNRKARKEGRKAERARCGQIFASSHAAKNIPLAAKLAFTTGMSANAVIAILEASPAAATGLSRRMETARVPQIGPGADQGGGGDASASIANSWDRATKPYAKTR